MWRLIRAAAESGRRRVRSGKTSEPVRQLLLQTDLNPQLRLLTSPVSSLSASTDCSSQKENKKIVRYIELFFPVVIHDIYHPMLIQCVTLLDVPFESSIVRAVSIGLLIQLFRL